MPYGERRIAIWTAGNSGKAKRLKVTPRITFQPCEWDGTVHEGALTVTGEADLVRDPQEYERIYALVLAKYGQEAIDAAAALSRDYYEERGGVQPHVAFVVDLKADDGE